MIALLLSFAETLIEVFSVLIAAHALVTKYSKKWRQITSWQRNLRIELPALVWELSRDLLKQLSLINLIVSLLVAALLFVPRLYRVFANSGILNHHGVQLTVSAAVFCIGMSAFWLKRKWQLQYGIGELIFGVASAYNTAAGLALKDAMFARWAALVGAMYVVSRGTSNIMDARESLSKTPDGKDSSPLLTKTKRIPRPSPVQTSS